MIYVIEDNPQIREVVVEYLRLKDYEVREFAGVRGVVDAAVHMPPELCILDVLLPDGNGFALAKKLREQVPEVPFIFLTAKDTESDRILGLELGAEDYVVKPFSPRELILRVEAVLRRTGKRGAQGETLWEWENSVLQIDEPSHTLAVDGTGIKLTSAEWKILPTRPPKPGELLTGNGIWGIGLNTFLQGQEET